MRRFPVLVEFGKVEKEKIPITATLVLFHSPSQLWLSLRPASWQAGKQARQQACIIGRPLDLPSLFPPFLVMVLIPFSEATDGAVAVVPWKRKSHGGGGHGLWGLGRGKTGSGIERRMEVEGEERE